MKTKLQLLLVPISAAALVVASCATHESEAQLLSKAKVSRADAEKTALASVPGGSIKEGGIEKEKAHIIWSFDVSVPGSADIKEVAVDALTGKVLDVQTETPAQQAKEAAEDAAKKK